MRSALAKTEASALAEYEAVIERGMETFVEVDNALLKIRDERLYRAEFGTFQEYCETRWEIDRRHANHLIDAAGVVENLGTIVPKPSSESVTRPLAVLPPPEQRNAWRAAVASAPNNKPTAKQVAAAVDKMAPARSRPADPERIVTVHNHVQHTADMPNGANGFRFWTQKMNSRLVRCKCGWSGLPHYRIRGLGSGRCCAGSFTKLWR